MRRSSMFMVTLMMACTAVALQATARDYVLGTLRIDHPWSRATPKGANTAAGYLAISNTGTTLDRLLGGTLGAAEHGELHQMTMQAGIMRMRPVTGGLEIKPGETLELKPDSFHLMFSGLKQPLIKGQSVKGSLSFEKAGTIDVEFSVAGVGAPLAHDPPGSTPMEDRH